MSEETCNGISWIYKLFADCIVTSRQKWSFGIGMLSNLIWVFASIPEIVTICRTKNVDGVSPFLFIFMVIGDFTGLAGNILTGGLATQIITNIVYIIFDCTLVAQWIYYRCKNGKSNKKLEKVEEDDNTMTVGAFGAVAAAVVAASIDYSEPYHGESLIGSLFGWVSGCIYTSSRLPQVYLKFKRRFVSNLSPFYFACTISENLTYFLSLFIRDSSASYMWRQCPWIIGALGPFTCDIITAFQMCIFGYSTAPLVDSGNKGKNDSEEDKFENADEEQIPEL